MKLLFRVVGFKPHSKELLLIVFLSRLTVCASSSEERLLNDITWSWRACCTIFFWFWSKLSVTTTFHPYFAAKSSTHTIFFFLLPLVYVEPYIFEENSQRKIVLVHPPMVSSHAFIHIYLDFHISSNALNATGYITQANKKNTFSSKRARMFYIFWSGSIS